MDKHYLIDSNVVIQFIKGELLDVAAVFVKTELKRGAFSSIITEIEVLGWKSPENSPEMVAAKTFFSGVTILGLARPVAEIAIQIRIDYTIKLPDAIIAATAIAHDLTLISRNDRDFRKISGLKYINPFTDL